MRSSRIEAGSSPGSWTLDGRQTPKTGWLSEAPLHGAVPTPRSVRRPRSALSWASTCVTRRRCSSIGIFGIGNAFNVVRLTDARFVVCFPIVSNHADRRCCRAWRRTSDKLVSVQPGAENVILVNAIGNLAFPDPPTPEFVAVSTFIEEDVIGFQTKLLHRTCGNSNGRHHSQIEISPLDVRDAEVRHLDIAGVRLSLGVLRHSTNNLGDFS